MVRPSKKRPLTLPAKVKAMPPNANKPEYWAKSLAPKASWSDLLTANTTWIVAAFAAVNTVVAYVPQVAALAHSPHFWASAAVMGAAVVYKLGEIFVAKYGTKK